MPYFEITRFNDETAMPIDIADHIANFFAANYPPSHSDEERAKDIHALINGSAVEFAIGEGSTFYVASEAELLAGFIKSRTVDLEDGTYEQLSWIMTAKEHRGRHLASLLHRAFIFDATERAAERVPKPTSALLNVHEQNPAQKVYEHWGYSVAERTSSGKLLMTMSLPVE